MPLTAADLSFSYTPDRPVLRGLGVSLEPGSLCAVVGPNGAGKSTLLRLLLGIHRPGTGTITLGGQPIHAIPTRKRARLLAYIPQRTSLAFAFSVREFVRFGRYAIDGRDDDRAVDAALERAGLLDRAQEPLGTLSAGQQQRAAVARALAQLDSPAAGSERFLLADEPVSAMDPRHSLEAMALLRSLADAGLGVAVVLHDLTLAARFCDRALVLDREGRLAAAGRSTEALSPGVLDPVFAVRFQAVGNPGGGSMALIPSLPPGH
jgi:ABC-type hemin transport system ATPase subunit